MGIIGAFVVPHPPLIVPSVGRGEEHAVQKTIDAYWAVGREIVNLNPEVIVISSPHAPAFRDAFHVTTSNRLRGSMIQFGAPQESIDASCDVAYAKALIARMKERNIPSVNSTFYPTDMDHGSFVPLYFVKEAFVEYCDMAGLKEHGDLPCPIVRIGLSGLGDELHNEVGECVAQVANECGKRVVYVASGDLSHKLKESGPYGFAKEGPIFDDKICEILTSGKLEEFFGIDPVFADKAAECGLRSFQIMKGALGDGGWQSELLSHEGTFGVGYVVARIIPESIDPYVALAREAVEAWVNGADLDEQVLATYRSELSDRAGAFVSLHKKGALRGCIGTIEATKPTVADEIVSNARAACSRDPRFNPVEPHELDYLEYSVDVLSQAEPIRSTDDLDVKRYGVIVRKGWQLGLLLPNLEGVDTIEEQVSIAKRKAGISPKDNDVQLERFEVIRHTCGGEARKSD